MLVAIYHLRMNTAVGLEMITYPSSCCCCTNTSTRLSDKYRTDLHLPCTVHDDVTNSRWCSAGPEPSSRPRRSTMLGYFTHQSDVSGRRNMSEQRSLTTFNLYLFVDDSAVLNNETSYNTPDILHEYPMHFIQNAIIFLVKMQCTCEVAQP